MVFRLVVFHVKLFLLLLLVTKHTPRESESFDSEFWMEGITIIQAILMG